MNSERTSTNIKMFTKSERKDSIKRDTRIKDCNTKYKRGVEKDMENLRKKNQTEILETKIPLVKQKNTVESHFNRPEQMEDRISELEDKIEIKEKTEEILVKQLKTCESNMQECSNYIKRPNLKIMGVEEGEVQA
jgi:chromosome segregation ATPase